MSTPLVSVIVPNYNYAAFLKERLDSILEQTYRNIEVIVLDDCSTDDSVAILRQYEQVNSCIKPIIVASSNSGSPYRQWEKGIQLATGQFIWIAESDDVADPSLLEKTLKAFDQHPQAVLVQVDSLLIDDQSKPLQKDIDHWKRNHITPNSIQIVDGKKYVRQQMYWKNRIYNASGVVVRRDCITPQVLATLIIPHISDWVFWSAIAIQGDIILLHERLNRFRQHATSLTHSQQAHERGGENEANVVHMLQQMVHVPYIVRLRRIRKICSRYHCWSSIRAIARIVLSND